jgi:hypothetical protein
MWGSEGGVGITMTIARGEVASSLSSSGGGRGGGRDIVVVVAIFGPQRRQCGGERGVGGQRRQLREGRSRCRRRHRAVPAKTRGKGWQGDDVNDDGWRGNRVFVVVVVVVVVDFGGATSTWRWGGRAVAGMLRCWRGGGEGEQRAALEGDGLNNQHNFVSRARKN